MILIMMQSRSMSSLLAAICEAHGYPSLGSPRPNQFGYKEYENVGALRWIRAHKDKLGFTRGDFCRPQTSLPLELVPRGSTGKFGVELWPLFGQVPWLQGVLLPRRRITDVVASVCAKNPGSSPALAFETAMARSSLQDELREAGIGHDVDMDEVRSGRFLQLGLALAKVGVVMDADKVRACIKKPRPKPGQVHTQQEGC